MKHALHLASLLLCGTLTTAVCCVGQDIPPSPPVAPSTTVPQAALDELQAAWPRGTRLVAVEQREHQLRFWTVDSFEGDLITVSRRCSRHEGGRDVFRLRVVAGPRVEIVDAECVGVPRPIAHRKVTGGGVFAGGHLNLGVAGEWCWPGGKWTRFEVKGKLRVACDLDLLVEGALVRGTRTDPEAGQPATKLVGEIIQHDKNWLVIKVTETWKTPRGKQMNPTYQWRFERDGVDQETGLPRWKVREGKRVTGEKPGHRSNWRGHVVLDQGRLVGHYGFDWDGMDARPGTMELTHPLKLEVLPEGFEGTR